MHAIVNKRAAGYGPLRKLQGGREMEKNVGLSGAALCSNGGRRCPVGEGSGVGSEDIKQSALTSRKPLTWLL